MTQQIHDQAFENFVPHSGKMVLLDKVVSWDDVSIHCTTSSHRCPDNPLLIESKLSIYAGIEYAAQAMAAHGWLLGVKGSASAKGFVVAVQKVNAFVDILSDVKGDLEVFVTAIDVGEQNSRYSFSINGQAQYGLINQAEKLIEGQMLVVTQ